MTAGVTPFWHQVRDQAAHVALGSVVGLVAAMPLLGAIGAAVIGAVREYEQWPTLKTPSLGDSLGDGSFVALGGYCGAAVMADWRLGVAAYVVTLTWAVVFSRLVTPRA